MNTPERVDLALYRGATFDTTVTWLDSDGDPVDLTGYTATFRAGRTRYGSTTVQVLALATGGDGITLGGVAGTIAVTATAAQTRLIPPGAYRYQLEVTSAGGTVSRIQHGRILVSPEVGP